MSRIGKKAIDIPKEVSIKMENNNITVKQDKPCLQRPDSRVRMPKSEIVERRNVLVLFDQ
jgi:ribosomal protein L6P/L9E